jgi:hypothetical protein
LGAGGVAGRGAGLAGGGAGLAGGGAGLAGRGAGLAGWGAAGRAAGRPRSFGGIRWVGGVRWTGLLSLGSLTTGNGFVNGAVIVGAPVIQGSGACVSNKPGVPDALGEADGARDACVVTGHMSLPAMPSFATDPLPCVPIAIFVSATASRSSNPQSVVALVASGRHRLLRPPLAVLLLSATSLDCLNWSAA